MLWNGLTLPDKPYYSDDAVVIYHGDCREILPELPNVDLVLTDPPYGIEYHSGHYIGYNPHKPLVGDGHYPIELLPDLEGLARKAVFMFCRWDNLKDVPSPKSLIAVVKNNWSAGDLDGAFGRQWEGVLFYPQEEFAFNHRLPDVIDCRRVPATDLLHPTQKAEYPIQLLIQECSMPNDIILDPFLGSGTTAYCAKKLNRKCIGIEIKEEYCEIAARRCSQAVMRLEEPKPPAEPAQQDFVYFDDLPPNP